MATAPGPRGLEALRWGRRFADDLQGTALAMRERWGPVVRLDTPLPGVPPVTIAMSVDGVRDVLTDRASFGKRNPVYLEMGRALGDGVLTSEGERWVSQRRTLAPLFTRRAINGYAAGFDVASASVARTWTSGEVVDLDAAMRLLTVRLASESLFGIDASRLLEPILRDVVVLSEMVLARGLSALPPWFPRRDDRTYHRMQDGLRRAMADVIDARNAALGDGGDDLVGLLQRATDPETGAGLSDEDVLEQAGVFLLAGHETTSTALTFALWELSRRPELQAAVRAEARAVLPEEPGATADVAAGLELTERVLQEAMRLHPPTPVTGRSVEQDATIDGFDVFRGEAVLTGFFALQIDPDHWDDPLAFDPDRFLPEQAEGRDGYAHLPFGAGPRSCIGAHFALLEAKIALARLLRDAELAPGPEHVETSLGITMTPTEPVLVPLA